MALLLVQHGKSLPKEIDPEQGLSDEGKTETWEIAFAARDNGVRIRRIVQSGKKRAAQTAEIFASELRPAGGVHEGAGLNPMDDVTAFAERIAASEDLMLVGHLPFMETLASLLITGDAGKKVIRFQNSGIVCLDKDEGADHWTIRWTLFPKIG